MAPYPTVDLRPNDVVVVEAYIERYPHRPNAGKFGEQRNNFAKRSATAAAREWRHWKCHLELHAVSLLFTAPSDHYPEPKELDFSI